MKLKRIAILIAAFSLIQTSIASAADFYYVMIFGSQTQPKRLKYAHTWATFVRATGEGPDASNYTFQVNTISWMPATLNVKVFSPKPETGVNLDLYQTLHAMLADKERITMWGPFQIRPELWNRSIEVRNEYESGRIQYRAISNSRNLLISDCIHAVAAVDPVFGRDQYPLIRIGKPASRFIARQVKTRTLVDQSTSDNQWIPQSLGLLSYPVEIIPPSAIPNRTCFLCMIPE